MTNVGENQGDEIFIHETVKREMFAHFFLRKVFLERDEIWLAGVVDLSEAEAQIRSCIALVVHDFKHACTSEVHATNTGS